MMIVYSGNPRTPEEQQRDAEELCKANAYNAALQRKKDGYHQNEEKGDKRSSN